MQNQTVLIPSEISPFPFKVFRGVNGHGGFDEVRADFEDIADRRGDLIYLLHLDQPPLEPSPYADPQYASLNRSVVGDGGNVHAFWGISSQKGMEGIFASANHRYTVPGIRFNFHFHHFHELYRENNEWIRGVKNKLRIQQGSEDDVSSYSCLEGTCRHEGYDLLTDDLEAVGLVELVRGTMIGKFNLITSSSDSFPHREMIPPLSFLGRRSR